MVFDIILNRYCNSSCAHLDLVPHLAVLREHSCGVEWRLGNHHGLLKETSQCWNRCSEMISKETGQIS